MKTITLEIGSTEWIKARSASKAAAVMGLDAHTSRNELLRMMATGIGKEFTDWQQKNLLDKGQETEIGARDIAEDILCDSLSPVCGSTDDGYLTASFDGIQFDGKVALEAKTWNERLADDVRQKEVPDSHWPQLEQQIIVGNLDYVLFMVTDGTREKCVSMEYRAVPGRAELLMASWKQFDIDLADYQHVESAPVAVAAPIKDLPAVVLTVSGELAIKTNFDAWGVELRAFIKRIPEKPTTDQEFADCKAAIAAFKQAEAQLDSEESRVLSLVPDIDQMKRDKQLLRDLSSTTRLALEKLVARRETDVKIEIMEEGKVALAAHVVGLSKRLGKLTMPPILADWAAAIKSKRNLENMRDAVSALVANKKIEANAIADKIDANLKALEAAGHEHLFKDYAALAMKAPDDLALVIKTRIDDEAMRHKEENERTLEAERQKIRAEEEAKVTAKAKAEQEEAERQRRISEEVAAKITADRIAAEYNESHPHIETAAQPTTEQVTRPPSRLATESVAPAAIDNGARIKLGEISERLGFAVTEAFLVSLGFMSVETIKNAKMYRESNFVPIVAALIDRLEGVRRKDWRAAA